MNNRLEQRLQAITDDFVRELMGTLRSLVAGTIGEGRVVVRGRAAKSAGGRGGRRGRRSPAQTLALAKKVAAAIARHSKGIRIEQLGKQLGMRTAELMLPIKKALAGKLIRRTGEKRATTYFAAK